MLRIDNIKMPLKHDVSDLIKETKRLAGCESITDFEILKKSIDARDKGKIHYVYSVAFSAKNENKLNSGVTPYEKGALSLEELVKDYKWQGKPPVVVGTGPAGLFLALSLAYMGAKPVVFERGSDVDTRKEKVSKFISSLKLDTECNVQFGEGGAGTFSDGKLNTNLNNEFLRVVLREFVLHGAPEEILFDAKPHIGTDKLINVVRNIRKTLIELQAEIHFDSVIDDVEISCGEITAVMSRGTRYECDKVFFATGHSARDTYKMLFEKGVFMEQKPFSMGVRIEHKQSDISFAQYGKSAPLLPPADYKMAVHMGDRSLYTFCMCPGGKVINASSEQGCLCVNGMSEYARDGINANSAILVNVNPSDFGGHPLSGIEFQRKYEKRAFEISRSYRAPVQLLGDFLQGKESVKAGEIAPGVGTGYSLCDLHACLPDFVAKGIAEGVVLMSKKLRGFDKSDSVLTGVETRSSSPVRIARNEKYESNIGGLYAVGEGAGYAGGIMSSAIDAVKCALSEVKL